MVQTFDTPILFLIFNRYDIAQNIFNQIRKIKPKFLFVAADGPRFGNVDDKANCTKTREIINHIDWPCEVKTLFRDINLGCGTAISSAINWFFDQVQEGIILEDDCLPDLSFFPFCEELLAKYRDDENIHLISGSNLQNGIKRGNASYYFSYYPMIWGWATWKRSWLNYKFDLPEFEETFKSGQLNHIFQSNNEKLYWRNKIHQLESQKVKHTWDYQLLYAIWKNKGICISPNENLVVNLGFRNASTHLFLRDSIREPSVKYSIQFPLIHPQKVVERKADHYIFKHVFSHSFSRFIRLTKENGISTVFRYALSKFPNFIQNYKERENIIIKLKMLKF